jgi:hypothetical protein
MDIIRYFCQDSWEPIILRKIKDIQVQWVRTIFIQMKNFFGLFICLFLSIGILHAQHLKKDGNPDKRYKENKSSYSTPSNSGSSYSYPGNSGTHVKKDGSPDKRYKENRTTGSHPEKNGKIMRSESAKHEFMKQSGYPRGRPGYVVDHKIPLKKGGCDCPSNMQWQTIEEAKAKDKWE